MCVIHRTAGSRRTVLPADVAADFSTTRQLQLCFRAQTSSVVCLRCVQYYLLTYDLRLIIVIMDPDEDYVLSDVENDVSSGDETELSDSEIEDDEDDTPVDYNPTWSPHTSGMKDIPFTGNPGIKNTPPGDNRPIDWFLLFFDDIMLENIAQYTNKYAETLYYGPQRQPQSRIGQWKNVTVPELKKVLALIIHMGHIRLNRMRDYWKTDEMYDLKYFRKIMARDRFLLIFRCICFSKPALQSDDRLAKVRFLIDNFNNTMLRVYYPEKELSLDEGMILWRGRLLFRQYIKGKKHKYGLKVYALCEPDGLTLRCVIYSGKGGELGGKGHAQKVVMHLMNGMLRKGHSLYMDNYYNSFVLSSELLKKDTYCTGTLRADRKHTPTEVKNEKLEKGQTVARYAEGVLIAKWKDKRTVLYTSTEHENTMGLSRNKRGVLRDKPLPIIKYNAAMKGVDRHDQLLAYYPFQHKSIRWYKKVFVHFLMMAAVNSYKLYLIANPDKKTTLYDFRHDIVKSILESETAEPEIALARTPPNARQQRQVKHVLSKMTKINNERRVHGRRCVVCRQEGRKNKRTVYFCVQCPNEPALCPVGCFDKYHANLKE